MNVVACYKALADETRYSIFKKLRDEALCACNILESLNITQPTLSFHMRKLTDCGLILASKEGIWTRYRVNDEYVKLLMNELSDKIV